MLVPRFSIRTLLLLLTLAAVASVIVGMAVRGQNWAWGASVGILSVLVTALVHAAWFGVVWIFAQMSAARGSQQQRTGKQP